MQILQITDGTTTIDLLSASGGYLLSSWLPQVAEYKDGGVWQDSKIAEGRRPVMGIYGNVTETMSLWIGATSQDNVAVLVHNLDTLLENAFAYHQPGSIQSVPIYLVAKANSESNTRYAVIYKGALTGFSDPFYKELETGLIHGGYSKTSGQANLTLTIERGHWLSHAPGTGTQINTFAEITANIWSWSVNTSLPSHVSNDIIRLQDNRILSLATNGQLVAGDSTGSSWSEAISSSNMYNTLCQAANGDIYAGGSAIFKSVNNAGSFLSNYSTNVSIIYKIIQTGGGTLLAAGIGTGLSGNAVIWRSTNNGSSWTTVLETNGTSVQWLLEDSGGTLWAAVTNHILVTTSVGQILKSVDDGATWTEVFNLTSDNTIPCIREFSDGNLYFISRKNLSANSTLWWSDDSGATWNQKGIISFGQVNNVIQLTNNTLVAVGTISDNLSISISEDIGISWSTYNWSVFGGTGAIPQAVFEMAANEVFVSDVSSIIYGSSSLVTTSGLGLINYFANLGQTSFPFIEVASSSIEGSLPALSRLVISAASDYSNRIIVGLRQTSRGSAFTPYLNISNSGNFAGVSAVANDQALTAAFGGSSNAPTDVCGVYTAIGVSSMVTQFTLTLDATYVPQFYGIYRAFLRCFLTNGTSGDVGVRLQIATGSGGIGITTDTRYPTTNTEFEVLDFGQITLPASGVFKSTDVADVTQIRVQCSSSSGTSILNLYDLILIPVDEWVGDFMDKANENDSDIGFSNSIAKMLDVDSLTDPRNPVKAVVRRQDNSYITSKYKVVGGPAILRPNVGQRLWFFFMQTSSVGDDYTWIAPPNIQAGINVYAATRYKFMRGNQ